MDVPGTTQTADIEADIECSKAYLAFSQTYRPTPAMADALSKSIEVSRCLRIAFRAGWYRHAAYVAEGAK